MNKRIISLLLVVVMILPFGIISVSATDDGSEYSANDFMTWTQGDPRWGDYKYGTTNTIRQSGCMITTIAVLIAYSDPSKRDWTVFNPKIAVTERYVGISGNIMPSYHLSNDYASVFKLISAANYGSQEAACNIVRQHKEEGYYSYIWAYTPEGRSHFSPITGWNDETDTPIVWDVGSGKSVEFFDFRPGETCYVIASFESSISSSLDTVYNTNFNAGTDAAIDSMTEEQREEFIEGTRSVALEWELNGMPKVSDMASEQMMLKVGDVVSWEQLHKTNMAYIKDIMDADKWTIEKFIGAAFVFAGMLLILYAVLLILAYAFDKSNAFIDISLVSLVSFGVLKLWDDEMTEEVIKQGYISERGFFIRIAVIAVVGVLFVSGVLTSLMYQLYGLLK